MILLCKSYPFLKTIAKKIQIIRRRKKKKRKRIKMEKWAYE
jgi:hypothetical protein